MSVRIGSGRATRLLLLAALGGAMLFTSACRQPQWMANQPRYEPYEESEFFEDGMSARPLVEGTVPRSAVLEGGFEQTGLMSDGSYAPAFPFEVTEDVMRRGRERFDIYCSMCHGATGYGNGVIVRRGYRQPPSFHEQRLRDAQPGYIVDVITKGFGSMPSYAAQVPVRDRWAIAAYVRALQYSQNAPLSELTQEEIAKLDAPSDAVETGSHH